MELLVTPKEAAQYLGISTTSVINWVRHGYLMSYKNLFKKEELEEVKAKIETGEIKRLNSRANKSESKNRFIPDEYISDKDFFTKITQIVDFIIEYKINIDQALFFLAINLLKEKGDIFNFVVKQRITLKEENFKRKGVYKHIQKWLNKLSFDESNFNDSNFKHLLNYDLPNEKDILGVIYQSIIHEGEKADLGSYYTPTSVVENLINKSIKPTFIALDPCCGTGQFLLSFSETIKNPNNIYGFDIDEKAVDIAITNLLLSYTDFDFTPNIYNFNSLTFDKNFSLSDKSRFYEKFDFIATNPPWGAKYDKKIVEEIKSNFKEIFSKESFSFFICQSYRFLKNDGVMSFILPESITNVKTHSDIRSFIISNLSILQINILGKKFKKVFSSVISMEMKKNINKNQLIKVLNFDNEYLIEQKRFELNKNSLFDIYTSSKDDNIFKKLTEKDFTTLENSADWALGIVTGNNKKFIMDQKYTEVFEPIYKGADVEHFMLKKEKSYIHFLPDLFQQVAPVKRYRAREKLIYKFISSNLVFAYDNKQLLTLNSANILIPQIKDYPIILISAFLNSELFNFYYKKKFNSIKILRGDIEQLPLPILTKRDKNELTKLIKEIVENKSPLDRLNKFVYNFYGLSDSETEYIKSFFRK